MSESLACGHEPSPHSAHTTGYAELNAATYDYDAGDRVCCACADNIQRDRLKIERSFVAYLNRDGSKLTTWTGGELATVTRYRKVANNFSRDGIVKFRAVDVHGQGWYGTSPGNGMYARMHRAK